MIFVTIGNLFVLCYILDMQVNIHLSVSVPSHTVTWMVNPIELVAFQSNEGIFLLSFWVILMLGGAILKHSLVPIG